MSEKEGYEVIRFIERGANCYASTDYVKGITLYNWIERNNTIEKEKLHIWIREIIKQLAMYHKQHGNPDYYFLNPYNIIITGKNKIVLVSTEGAQKNVNQFSEKYFTPVNQRQDRDIYCVGKIIQFIMAHIQCEPRLTKKEEYKLLKIVRKCLESDRENQYENIQCIQNNFIKEKKVNIKIPNFRINKKAGVAVAVILFVAAGYFIWQEQNMQSEAKLEVMEEDIKEVEEGAEAEDVKEIENEKVAEDITEIENAAEKSQYWDIGLSYFLELKNYEKSKEYFEKAGEREVKAKQYMELADFMTGNSLSSNVETVLEELKEKIRNEAEADVREVLILMRVYSVLDTEEGYKSVIELSEEMNIEEKWQSLTEEMKEEFCQTQAKAYEKMKTWEEMKKEEKLP